MIVLFVIGTLLVLDLIWAWQADRLLRGVPNARRWRLAHLLLILFLMAGLAGMVVARVTELPVEPPLLWTIAVYVWHLLLLPSLLILTAFGQTARFFLWMLGLFRRKDNATSKSAPPSGAITRRQFLRASAVALPPLLLGAATITGLQQIRQFRVRTFEISIAGLPADLGGFRIAHLSDSHSGRFTGAEMLEKFVKATGQVDPDLIVFTGDLINNALADLPMAIDMLRELRAPHGLYICEGNHDLIESRAGFESGLRQAGLNLLVNETRDFNVGATTVSMMGLRWGSGGSRVGRDRNTDEVTEANVRETFAQVAPGSFPILLAHHPHAFDTAAELGIPLTLAGHTHGGQLMLNDEFGFGPAMFDYWSGLYTRDHSAMVVSNGIGNWFPVRTSAPAELIVAVLKGK